VPVSPRAAAPKSNPSVKAAPKAESGIALNKGSAGTKKSTTNWGRELKTAFSVVGKVLLKALSYLLNVLLTVLLICFITGFSSPTI